MNGPGVGVDSQDRPPFRSAPPPAPAGWRRYWTRLQAGLAFSLWLLPGLMIGLAITLFVIGQNVAADGGARAENPTLVAGFPGVAYALVGMALGALAWLYLGWFAGRYCAPSISNSDEYHKLATRLAAIDATLSIVGEAPPPRSVPKQLALAHARRARDSATAWLTWDVPDQQWAYGDLYVSTWRHVHAAEEALAGILPATEVVADASMDLQRLKQSTIVDSDSLAEQVKDAMKALREAVVTPDRDDDDGPRAEIRAVRAAINAYRDGRSIQLVELGRKVRTRHIGLSAMIFLLFALAIVALDPRAHLVEAFAVYFVVGALAGIALEASRSSRSRSSAQDYGLNRERLFLTFTMSGVAACGGVILFVMLLATTLADLVSAAPPAFKPEVVLVTPVLILVAAAFGLAPSRLFTAITGLGEQIAIQAELASSTATGGTTKKQKAEDEEES